MESLGERPGNGPAHVVEFAPGEEAADRHPVQDEGARFVHAQHRGCAKGFHGRHPPGEDPLAGQAPGPKGEKHREHQRKLLREHRHRQGDPGQEPGQPVAAGKAIHHHHHGTEGQPAGGEGPHQPPGFLLEWGLLRLDGGQRLADPPLHHQRPGEDERRIVPARPPGYGRLFRVPRLRFPRHLPHRNRLSGEQRLVDRQVEAPQDLRVGWDAVAFRQDNQVARDHLPAGDAPLLSVPDDQGPRAREVAQRLQRPLRRAFLVDGDAQHHHDKAEQHQGLARVPKQQIDDAPGDQEQEHGLRDHFEGDRQAPLG